MLLLDTSVLLEILRVPFESDRHAEVVEQFQRHVDRGVELRLPVAAVLETGSHVRRIRKQHDRERCADRFVRFLTSALTGDAPWSFLSFDWTEAVIQNMIDGTDHDYPLQSSLALGVFEIGDLAIVEEWRTTYLNVSRKVVDVDVWTLDATLRAVVTGLKAQQPPRRRRI